MAFAGTSPLPSFRPSLIRRSKARIPRAGTTSSLRFLSKKNKTRLILENHVESLDGQAAVSPGRDDDPDAAFAKDCLVSHLFLPGSVDPFRGSSIVF